VPLEKAGFRSIVNEDLSKLGTQGYRRVQIGDARPGDVVVLGPPPRQWVGHRAIVAEVRAATPNEVDHVKSVLGDRAKTAATGNVQVYAVDSSWGDYGDPKEGGVKRETWLCFHQKTGDLWMEKWGTSGLVATPRGPYDHPLLGVYRSKEMP
jgi:hypothetical protein